MSTMKIGIIGCGKISLKHISGYNSIPNTQVFISDIVDAGRKYAEDKGATWVESPQDLLNDPEITAIDICTPTHTHADYALKALRSGKHVFCEKPITNDIEALEAIAKAEQETGKVVMSGFIFKFHPAFRLLRQLLDDGTLGNPKFGLFRIGGIGSHRTWKHKKDTGGGVVWEMLVHILDLAQWYFGDPVKTQVCSYDTICSERVIEGQCVQADVEDLCIIRMDTPTGATVICESDFTSSNYMNYIEVHCENGSFFGSIIDDLPCILTLKEARGEYPAGKTVLNFEQENLFVREMGMFVESITSGTKPPFNTTSESLSILKTLKGIG